VHRDVKPGNVMLTLTGVKILDFGISAATGDPDEDETGVTFGTPAYVTWWWRCPSWASIPEGPNAASEPMSRRRRATTCWGRRRRQSQSMDPWSERPVMVRASPGGGEGSTTKSSAQRPRVRRVRRGDPTRLTDS
jgi:serine/threonine protein kinase